MRRAIVVLVAVLTLSATPSCSQPTGGQETPREGFQKFWSGFRQAALAGDKDKVASFAAFPFKTRGILDSDPVKAYDRASFTRIFDQLLDQDPGLSREPGTMRRLIERTTTVTDKMLGTGGQTARVGVFTFQRMDGRWRFTMAYREE